MSPPRTAVEVTDANAAFFDAANGFAGCIAGINDVLRRQGLLASSRCLDPQERLSAGQAEDIDRVPSVSPSEGRRLRRRAPRRMAKGLGLVQLTAPGGRAMIARLFRRSPCSFPSG